jgi:hypothetical protein
MNADRTQRDLTRWIEAEISRTTGRRYRISLQALDVQSLREFQRLFRDLETEKQQAATQVRMYPWRR